MTRDPRSKTEKCSRCGQPCDPVQFVYSAKQRKNLPQCSKCATKWNEGGSMPE